MEAQAIAVRAAVAEDAAAIAQIHVDAWRVAYRGVLPEDEIHSITFERRRSFWEGALAAPRPDKVDVAEDGTRVIAFCSYGPTRDRDGADAAEIYAVYVHPHSWRRGAGRLLCERAVAAAAEREHRAITLWVVKGNDPARRFYERIGFAPDGTERSNTRFLKTPFDEVRYRKPIP